MTMTIRALVERDGSRRPVALFVGTPIRALSSSSSRNDSTNRSPLGNSAGFAA
jgi:hypothetical protein